MEPLPARRHGRPGDAERPLPKGASNAVKMSGLTGEYGSANALVAARHTVGAQDDLPEFYVPATEGGRAGEEVIAEHAGFGVRELESFGAQPLVEPFVPGHEGGVIVRAEIVAILQHEEPVAGPDDGIQRGQLAVGKNVAGDPGVTTGPQGEGADGMQQKEPARLEQPPGRAEEAAVVLAPHMLEHADGHDAVK